MAFLALAKGAGAYVFALELLVCPSEALFRLLLNSACWASLALPLAGFCKRKN